MEKLEFKTEIKASAARVWQILWSDYSYRIWAKVFQEGSFAKSDWKEGSKIQFMNPDGNGIAGIIEVTKPREQMSFKHLTIIKNHIELPDDEESKTWSGSMEEYFLKEENGVTHLTVRMDFIESFKSFFESTFPKAFAIIKDLSEKPVALTISTEVNASLEKVWNYFTQPDHVMKWNNASDDWHTPKASNDLRAGGKFIYTMAAKDESFSFDFSGVYTEVELHKKFEYRMDDGRMATVSFSSDGNKCKITETFEAEEMNSLDLQLMGWQAILNNFKKYTESN